MLGLAGFVSRISVVKQAEIKGNVYCSPNSIEISRAEVGYELAWLYDDTKTFSSLFVGPNSQTTRNRSCGACMQIPRRR